jgi:hypothetical protein
LRVLPILPGVSEIYKDSTVLRPRHLCEIVNPSQPAQLP